MEHLVNMVQWVYKVFINFSTFRKFLNYFSAHLASLSPDVSVARTPLHFFHLKLSINEICGLQAIIDRVLRKKALNEKWFKH